MNEIYIIDAIRQCEPDGWMVTGESYHRMSFGFGVRQRGQGTLTCTDQIWNYYREIDVETGDV
jgi:hypothetical protein